MQNLTPEQLAALQQMDSGGYTDPSGRLYSYFNSAGADPYILGLTGHAGDTYIGGSGKEGDAYNIYDASGADTGKTGQYAQDINFAKLMAQYGLVLAGAAGAGGAFGGGLFGGGAGTVGTGAGDVGMAALTDGADMTALNGGLADIVPGAASGSSAMDYRNGSDIMSDTFDANGAHGAGGFGGTSGLPSLPGAPGSPGTPGVPGASDLTKLLGPAAAIIGGAAGAAGKDASTTGTRDLPEWMKPYVTNLFDKSQGLLNDQMTPERQAGYRKMETVGQGLLNQPIAGNGFDRFTKGRR